MYRFNVFCFFKQKAAYDVRISDWSSDVCSSDLFEKSADFPGHNPKMNAAPSAMKAMIAATLMPANQNSNSPYDATEKRLVAVIRIMKINADRSEERRVGKA